MGSKTKECAKYYESLGYKVKVVLNEHDNHKLTRKEDFYNL